MGYVALFFPPKGCLWERFLGEVFGRGAHQGYDRGAPLFLIGSSFWELNAFTAGNTFLGQNYLELVCGELLGL